MKKKNALIEAKTMSVPVSPQVAFRRVVHEYGVEEMAAQLLMVPGTLHNKCNCDQDSHHKPTLKDVVDVTRITGDHRILESLDRMFGRAGYDLTPGPVCDSAILELLCKVASESGAMHQALMTGLQDRRFSLLELQAVRAEAFDLVNAVLSLQQRLEGLVDA